MTDSDPLRQMLAQLDASQWLAPADLRAWQLEQATRLLRYAAGQVPFYAQLGPLLPRPGEALDMDRWRELPLLKRTEVQRAGATLTATQVPPEHLPLEELVTSGSTGSPVRVATTALTRLFWNALTLRDHLWHRRDWGGRLAAIRYCDPGIATYPEGTVRNTWGPPTDLLYTTGGSALLNVRTGLGKQLEWLARQAPAYLITYPSNALELGRSLAGARLPGLRELRLFGEVADAALVGECRERFGVPVIDLYSANEVGYMALQCAEHGHYHEQAESVLVEVLDESGRPCAPGDTGRVVVTALWNYAMPLIRYDIGDYAQVGEACPCGRGLPVLRRILGRTRNLLTLPSGERLWPSLGIASMRSLAPIVQCQIVQHAIDRLEARLVVERPLSPAEEGRIRANLLKKLGCTMRIDISYPECIERGPAWKFEEFRSLL